MVETHLHQKMPPIGFTKKKTEVRIPGHRWTK